VFDFKYDGPGPSQMAASDQKAVDEMKKKGSN